MAGRGGFEPPEVLPSPVFKTGAFDPVAYVAVATGMLVVGVLAGLVPALTAAW